MKFFCHKALQAMGLLLLAAVAAHSVSVQALTPVPPRVAPETVTAIWIDPAIEAQGWVLEGLPGSRGILAYWYGYDESGQLVWYFGTAERVPPTEIFGSENVFEVAALFSGTGARFGDAFDPKDVDLEPVGRARFAFDSCSGAAVEFTVEGVTSEQRIQRLTRTMGVSCELPLNGVPGRPIQAYAGQSGTWYNPERDGEGFTVQWIERNEAVLYWFTYDTEGKPYWLFGVGARGADGVIRFPTLRTLDLAGGLDGGVAGETPGLLDWGSLEMTLGCMEGQVSYASDFDEFGSGSRSLQRLTRLAQPECPYVPPTLDELYAFSVKPLPVPNGGDFQVWDIADDGTLVGMRTITQVGGVSQPPPGILRLEPDAERWASVPLFDRRISRDGPVFLSPGGETIFAAVDTAFDESGSFHPLAWNEDTGWQPLAGFPAGRFLLLGASQDRSQLTGALLPENDEDQVQGWVWNAQDGVRFVPVANPGLTGAFVTAVANDGNRAAGFRELLPVVGPIPGATPCNSFGALWRMGDEAAQCIRDEQEQPFNTVTACNGDCSLVFGSGDDPVEFSSEMQRLAWLWGPDGRSTRLEPVGDLAGGGLGYELQDISADGSLAVGLALFTTLTNPLGLDRAFIWTQRTGASSLDEVLEAVLPGLGLPGSARHERVIVNRAGSQLVISGRDNSRGLSELWLVELDD